MAAGAQSTGYITSVAGKQAGETLVLSSLSTVSVRDASSGNGAPALQCGPFRFI